MVHFVVTMALLQNP